MKNCQIMQDAIRHGNIMNGKNALQPIWGRFIIALIRHRNDPKIKKYLIYFPFVCEPKRLMIYIARLKDKNANTHIMDMERILLRSL